MISKLEKLDPDLRVFTNGYEGGYNDAVVVEGNIINIVTNYNTEWYYGKHESANKIKLSANHVVVKGIVL